MLLHGTQRDSSDWPLKGSDGRYGVRVRGTLSSNSVETIRAGVLAGVGIGLMTKASLTSELSHPDIITVLDEFVSVVRDVSLSLAETPLRSRPRSPSYRLFRRRVGAATYGSSACVAVAARSFVEQQTPCRGRPMRQNR